MSAASSPTMPAGRPAPASCSHSVGSCSGEWDFKQELGPEEGISRFGGFGECSCVSKDDCQNVCPRCRSDLAPRAFSWINHWLKTSGSSDPRARGRSPFVLALTLCAVLGVSGPQGRSPVLASAVLTAAVLVLNVFAPYALTAYEAARRELADLVARALPGTGLQPDLSFEDEALQLEYQGKLSWLRSFKDRGGAALYYLCAGGRVWNSLMAGDAEVLPLLLYLPLALLYALRLGRQRRGPATDSALCFAHILMSSAVVPSFFFSSGPDDEAAHAAGPAEGVLTFLVNPVMFMATTCLSLPAVGSLRWDAISLAFSLAVYIPTSASFLLSEYRATGQLLGFAVGRDVGLMVFGLTTLPLLFAAAFNFCHLVTLHKFSVHYFLTSKTCKAGKQ